MDSGRWQQPRTAECAKPVRTAPPTLCTLALQSWRRRCGRNWRTWRRMTWRTRSAGSSTWKLLCQVSKVMVPEVPETQLLKGPAVLLRKTML